MKFIIQTVKGKIRGLEEYSLVSELDSGSNKLLHEYILSDTSVSNDIADIADWIPVGSIQFLEEHLRVYHNVDKMTPIEVPKELRSYKFLKRKYDIVHSNKDLPDNGYWFVKKIDRLKEFTNLGCVGLYKDNLDDGTYIVSEVLEILSEYRVFVINNVVQGIQFYSGDCLELPSIPFIKEAITEYSKDSNIPKAYTIDIAVTTLGNVVLEIHPFASCGLYGLYTEHIPLMYKLGYDYYKERGTNYEV